MSDGFPSDRYVATIQTFNVVLNIGFIIYHGIRGTWWLLFWIPNGILATYLAISGARQRAIKKAKKQ